MLCLPGHGPHWSRLAVGFPLDLNYGVPRAGAAPSALLRGGRTVRCEVLLSCPGQGKAPGSCSTLTLPDVPVKRLLVMGLATGDSQLLRVEIPHGHDVDGAIFCTITPVYSG